MSSLLDIRCPNCRSKQLSTTGKSSGKITLTCVACGYVFKVVDEDMLPGKIVGQPARSNVVHEAPITRVNDLNTLNRRIIEIAQSIGKLNAIKYCSDTTGWDLEKCKKYVDQLIIGEKGNDTGAEDQQTGAMPAGEVTLDQTLVAIARNKGKLHAVKHYKDLTGQGLKESLAYIERLVPRDAIKKQEGCFIATACYGDYNAAEVKVLRRYRDEQLQKTRVGKAFVKLYYLISPSLANLIKETGWLNRWIRRYMLAPVVRHLQVRRPARNKPYSFTARLGRPTCCRMCRASSPANIINITLGDQQI